ncbi:alpha/beta fold hydrolase [Thermodesulfobacteriota bacterium]
MVDFVPWNSQSLDAWASKYAPGKFIELDGLSTHYIEKGSGEPVILLHGFFFDTYMWNKNIDLLAEKYKVYAIDLWGFGYSTRKPLDYGYPLYTKQLLKFMDSLGISRASLIGQSMGGGTIINFTVSNRHMVDKIILIDAAGMPNKLPIMGRISNLPKLGEFMYGLNSDFLRRMTLGNTFLHNKKNITDEYFENATRFHKIKGTTEVMLYITREQFFDTLLEEIKKLSLMNIPTLIVWGREEKSIPLSVGREMHRILKGSQLEIFDQAGHCAHDDQPEMFNQLVSDFLALPINAS